MLLRLLGIEQDWSPWGTAVYLYLYYCFCFVFSFPLLSVWFEPAICSVAPRSAIVSCLLLWRGKKEKCCETFLNSQSASGRKACRLGSKGKKLHFRNSWGAGNSKVKGQHGGSLIKKEKGGRGGGRLIDCFLSMLQSALSVLSSLSTAWLHCPLECLKCLFITGEATLP